MATTWRDLDQDAETESFNHCFLINVLIANSFQGIQRNFFPFAKKVVLRYIYSNMSPNLCIKTDPG